jgi:hypothetical protein
MQVAAPEAVDLKQETAATRAMYGIGETPTDEYGTAVLRARRLVERGVRFVHVISGTQEEGIQSWDAHQEIEKNHSVMSKTVDKPIGALLRDLKARGLLDSTLVVWTSEFGRTPYGQTGDGRDHNPWGYTSWIAGGGIKPGSYGQHRRDRPARAGRHRRHLRPAGHSAAAVRPRSPEAHLPASGPHRARDHGVWRRDQEHPGLTTMQRKWRVAGAALATLALAAGAYAADLDLSDFDDSLMRSMDDAIKDLDSNVGGQELGAAQANVEVLRDGLAWAEKYFSAKPEAPRGAGFARESQENLALVTKSLEARDFDAASNGVRAVVRSCKACHEAYKPPE